jgi:outer membrane protein OmpA-like peptidoglycan-associated protein
VKMIWKAVPLVVATGVLTGCAGVQKSDWPVCAAVGGVTGAAIGAIESSAYAGWGGLIAAVTAGGYCWVHGQGEEEVVMVEETVMEPAPAPVVEEQPEAVRVELDVKFDFDKSVVKSESYGDIKSLADFMSQYPQTTTVVEGHTDSVGTDAYNQRLSERRANAVRDVLVNQYGVGSNRVSSVGYGESRPVADNSTEQGRAVNRRVEAEVEAQP